jgi:murein DD-endopeptidase MepM/ murein hydrolase activator NlpD
MRRSTLLIALATALLLSCAPVADAAKLGTRQIRIGSRGGDVKQLQRALRELGYKIAVDGDFGPKTDGAVRGYERSHHMTVDGIVGRSEAATILKDAALAMLKDNPPASGGQGDNPPPSGGQGDNPPPSGGQGPPAEGGSSPPASDPPPTSGSPSPPPAAGTHVFPVQGPFSFGGPDARFGAPRGDHTHQGQDVLAAESTPVVSVSAGTVYWRSYQSGGAGYYVVIHGTDGYDYVYMHFDQTALVAPGDRVEAGQPIGHVGHTGDASGPHLHFEVWDGHWQSGGHPVDPLPLLQSWLAGSSAR